MKASYVDHMGTDLSVVNAARVSFDKVSKFEYEIVSNPNPLKEEALAHKRIKELQGYWGDSIDFTGVRVDYLSKKDKKLIRYLASHKHELPFAHTSISLRISAPICIRTQCFKHKIGFVENEVSRRYVNDIPSFFVPSSFREAVKNKKQGSGEDIKDSDEIEQAYVQLCLSALSCYEDLLKKGVAPEQARMVLPQATMTTWIWTGSLLAFSRFYNLRSSPDAQKEIQDLALKVEEVIKPLFPVSWEALTKEIIPEVVV